MVRADIEESTSPKALWRHFVTTGEVSPEISPMIASSWMRCRELGHHPQRAPVGTLVDAEDLEGRLARNRDLLSVAMPILEQLQELVKDLGFLILLTDHQGVILAALPGAPVRDHGFEGNLCAGGIWSEEYEGTGGIGLALRFAQSVQVVGAEHFFERDHDLTCSAAPIFSPDNRLLGVLDLSGPSGQAHIHSRGIVEIASKAITNQLRIEEDHRQIWLANEYLKAVINSISDGVVAIDSCGCVKEINAEAANILATDCAQAPGKNIQELVGKQPLFQRAMDGGKPLAEMEATLETRRGYVHCQVSAKPIKLDGKVAGVVATLRETKKLHRVVNQITGAEARFTFANILGESSAMQRAIHLAQVASRNIYPVLIEGESGTGKELFAQAIHNASMGGQPFIAVNCGAIPETLIESELFGYEGGAFTGAIRGGRPGKFELANDGTLFLDEIGEMPLNVQTVLLRVLQERSVVRIGGQRALPVNVRVIAATNKDLAREAANGNFRQDLLYRLNIFEIHIPPLRERVEDIPPLIDHLLTTISARFAKSVSSVSLPVLKRFRNYGWPGNVRQLENVIARAISLMEGDVVEEQHLPDFLLFESYPNPITRADRRPPNIGEVEKQAILDAIQHCGARQEAAKWLGISRSTLYRRLKSYDVGGRK